MGRRSKTNEEIFCFKLFTTLQLGVIFVITILWSDRATGRKLIEGFAHHDKRAVDPARSASSSGQVPVINGVIGGGDPDDIDDQSKPSNRFRVYTNLITTDGAAAIANTTTSSNNSPSIQITGNVSACSTGAPLQPASMTGYIHLNQSRALFFWYLEASKNPDQAPLVLWLNGGPGSSSMIGLFQENGPCRIKLDSTGFDVNPQSWNENANMIYIDQPVGTGYSYGPRKIKSTSEAMVELYQALQIFLADSHFSKFVGRPFGVWAESYGGHYAPVLVDYILKMNLNSSDHNQTGRVRIPINSLGVGNGLTNALVQYLSYITYAQANPYNQTLVSKDVIDAAYKDFTTPATGCQDLIKTCQSSLNQYDCRSAQSFCNRQILSALVGNRDVYDVRQVDTSTYPPPLAPILNDSKFKAMIGVPPTVNWTESNEDIYMDFFSSGDWMLDSSKHLEAVINAGVRTLIYAGDADFIVNYQGVEALVTSLNTKLSNSFVNQTFSDWVIDDEPAGIYKTSGTLSYLRIFQSGHEVPAYGKGKLAIGQAAKKFFDQTISNRSIASFSSDRPSPAQSSSDPSAAAAPRLHIPRSLFAAAVGLSLGALFA